MNFEKGLIMKKSENFTKEIKNLIKIKEELREEFNKSFQKFIIDGVIRHVKSNHSYPETAVICNIYESSGFLALLKS